MNSKVDIFLKTPLVELQEKTGVHQSQWSRYLSNKQSITESTLRKAAEALSMTASELLEGIEKRRNLSADQSSGSKRSKKAVA